MPRLAALALALAAAVAVPLRASADPPAPAPAAAEVEDAASPENGLPHAPAADLRTGHPYLDGKFGLIAPAGVLGPIPERAIGASRSTADITGLGMTFGGVLGVGITRYVSLEVSGEYSRFGAPTGCVGCKGTGFDFGLGLAYHLAQGIAVDPWGSFGMGFRSATFTTNVDLTGAATGTLNDQAYRGFDFARIGLGADFYPASFFGFGPYFEADVGASLKPPVATGAGTLVGIPVYAFFQFGVRVAFDPFRSTRPTSPARSAEARR